MKIKKIFSILLFFLILIFANRVKALEINIGNTYTFELNYLTSNGYVADEFTVANCENDIISIEKVKTGIWPFKKITQIKITGYKEGETNLNLGGTYKKTIIDAYGNPSTQTEPISATIRVKVIDLQKVAEDLRDKIDDANQTSTDLEEAYKYIPKSTASAETIDRFIASDAEYNGGKRINSITNKTLLEAWETTVESAMIDTISREMYKDTLTAIQDRIYDREVSETTLNNLSNKMKNAIDATQKTVDNYEKQIMEIIKTQDGANRTKNHFTDVLDNINNFVPNSENPNGNLVSKVNVILTIITNIGMVLAVLMLAILGIKYMLGSLEEKAEYKKDMIPYLIGAFLLFGITTIVKVLQQLGQSFNNI